MSRIARDCPNKLSRIRKSSDEMIARHLENLHLLGQVPHIWRPDLERCFLSAPRCEWQWLWTCPFHSLNIRSSIVTLGMKITNILWTKLFRSVSYRVHYLQTNKIKHKGNSNIRSWPNGSQGGHDCRRSGETVQKCRGKSWALKWLASQNLFWLKSEPPSPEMWRLWRLKHIERLDAAACRIRQAPTENERSIRYPARIRIPDFHNSIINLC